MWGVRRGKVVRRDWRRERWTEDLSLDLVPGVMLAIERERKRGFWLALRDWFFRRA